MTHGPESALGVISEMARQLVSSTNMVQSAYAACSGCAHVFSAALAGVLISSNGNGLKVIASSLEDNSALDLLESQWQQDSGLELMTNQKSHEFIDIDGDLGESPFALMARDLGYRSTLSVPLTLRQTRVGVISVLWSEKREISDHDVTTLNAFADLTSASLFVEEVETDEQNLMILLERTYQNRVRIEQAKGMVAAARDCSLQQAFHLMGIFALGINITLTALAQLIVSRHVDARLESSG